jgi:hypothetical protein
MFGRIGCSGRISPCVKNLSQTYLNEGLILNIFFLQIFSESTAPWLGPVSPTAYYFMPGAGHHYRVGGTFEQIFVKSSIIFGKLHFSGYTFLHERLNIVADFEKHIWSHWEV